MSIDIDNFWGENNFQSNNRLVWKKGFHKNGIPLKKENNNSNNFQNDIRIAIEDKNKKWLDLTIPFLISEKFSAQNKELIERAIHSFQNTCIKFEPKQPEDSDYVVIVEGEGCNSPVGRQKGPQNVTLGEGCLRYNTIIHELMHSIGFFHEHQRYDRDDYILIHRENIKRGMEFEFNKKSKTETTGLDFEYDHNSVMQYEETAFSKNGRPTMESKVRGIKLGPNNGLSPADVLRINNYFGCDSGGLLPNEETVNAFDINLSCLDLKWKSFDGNIGKNLLVLGGNDSFGNRFYICRVSVHKQLIAGQMFQSKCYVIKNGGEVEVQDFQVLTHSNNGYKWHHFSQNQLPPNAVISGKGLTLNKTEYSIGRCSLKYSDYKSQVVGTISTNGRSRRQLSVAFNGIEIKCNEFEVLLCRTTKGHQNTSELKINV